MSASPTPVHPFNLDWYVSGSFLVQGRTSSALELHCVVSLKETEAVCVDDCLLVAVLKNAMVSVLEADLTGIFEHHYNTG